MDMKKIILLLTCLCTFIFAAETLPVYQKENPESRILGYLTATDKVEELPIPPMRKKVVKYIKQKKSKKILDGRDVIDRKARPIGELDECGNDTIGSAAGQNECGIKCL